MPIESPLANKVSLAPVDLVIIGVYLACIIAMGFWVKKRATQGLASYFLAGRSIPWWMLGLSGCSSYIDIGGTMAMVGCLYYLGLKGLWATHIWWGWFIICFYMAFQAKWIRRSGVMTFPEWNQTRFGTGRGVESARAAASTFLLLLMIFNLMYIAVGVGKFAEKFLPLPRWQSALLVFASVGLYVTAGGFFGVIYTDMLQTALIAVGAVILAFMVFGDPATADFAAQKPEAWTSLAPTWTLWDGFLNETPESYQHFYPLGPVLLASSFWCLFRVLAGPNVWDFQFFLTTRSPRDAALAAGTWTVGYSLRWIIGCAFLVLGITYLGPSAAQDAENIIPLVLGKLGLGVRGLFLAILLAALMSTLDAMINVTSSVITNDFLGRYFARRSSEKALVRIGQIASVGALILAFVISLAFKDVVEIWETMIFSIVTIILVPATFRWHWWRFGPLGFVWGMAGSVCVILLQKLLWPDLSPHGALAVDTAGCLAVTLVAGLLTPPAPMDVLVRFYARIRPFGFWGPVRKAAVEQGLVPAGDRMPAIDALNGILTMVFQFALAAIPFCAILRLWPQALSWAVVMAVLAVVLYFTWYRNLPSREET